MKKLRSTRRGIPRTSGRARTLTLGVVLIAAAVAVGAAQAAKNYAPARTAVVDIAAIFDGYAKKRDREADLGKKMESLKKDLGELEKQYESINQSLENLKEESPLYIDKLVEKKELELRVMQLRTTTLKELRERQASSLQELRKEITAEIEAFARLHQIELVLEKQVSMDGDSAQVGFRWPIVHFAQERLEISDQITAKLNEKYKKKT